MKPTEPRQDFIAILILLIWLTLVLLFLGELGMIKTLARTNRGPVIFICEPRVAAPLKPFSPIIETETRN